MGEETGRRKVQREGSAHVIEVNLNTIALWKELKTIIFLL